MKKTIVRLLTVLVFGGRLPFVAAQTPALAAGCGSGSADHYGSQTAWDTSRGKYVTVYDDLHQDWQTDFFGNCYRRFNVRVYTNDGSNATNLEASLRVWVCGTPQPTHATTSSNANSISIDNPYGGSFYNYGSCGAQADDYNSFMQNGSWSPQTLRPYSSF